MRRAARGRADSGANPIAPPFGYTVEAYAEFLEGFTAQMGLPRYAIYLHDYGSKFGLRFSRCPQGLMSKVVTLPPFILAAGWTPDEVSLCSWSLERQAAASATSPAVREDTRVPSALSCQLEGCLSETSRFILSARCCHSAASLVVVDSSSRHSGGSASRRECSQTGRRRKR